VGGAAGRYSGMPVESLKNGLVSMESMESGSVCEVGRFPRPEQRKLFLVHASHGVSEECQGSCNFSQLSTADSRPGLERHESFVSGMDA
jgi:hypothetical protein